MAMRRKPPARHGGISAAVLYAGAAALVIAPSAGFALSRMEASGPRIGLANFTPAVVDSRLAGLIANHRRGEPMLFTPAGAVSRQGRSVIVAIRVDQAATEALAVRAALGGSSEQMDSAVARITPTRFNLGLAIGYQSFAKAPALSRDLSEAAMPDLASFRPSPGARERPSRFAARIAVAEEQIAARASRSPELAGDQTFDLGGSYRVTRNLDVTAGVRYSQDRDRLDPLTAGKQDSQAVYVGTQFRF